MRGRVLLAGLATAFPGARLHPPSPEMVAGVRFLFVVGGGLLCAWLYLRRQAPEKAAWVRRGGLILAALMVLPGAARAVIETIDLRDKRHYWGKTGDRRLETHLPGRLKEVLDDVKELTPPESAIRLFMPDHHTRSMSHFLLLPRKTTAMLYDTPRPEYILIYQRQIPPQRLRDEQAKSDALAIVEYEAIKRWAGDMALLKAVKP